MAGENSFWGNIFKGDDGEDGSTRAILRKTPLFRAFTKRELASVERVLHERHYEAGEMIFHQGDEGIGMYIIEEGKVEIKLEPSGKVIAELGEGEIFGEIALINESPRSASAAVGEKSKIHFFSQPDLDNLLSRDPKVGAKISLSLARIVADRLINSNEQMIKLHSQLDEETRKASSKKRA